MLKQGIDEQDEEGYGILVKFMRAPALDTVAPSAIDIPEAPGLIFIPGDCNILHTTMAELMTRTIYGKTQFVLSQKMPNLWFAQIPNFIKAAHQNAGAKWCQPTIAHGGICQRRYPTNEGKFGRMGSRECQDDF
jgi:hypothetical protein